MEKTIDFPSYLATAGKFYGTGPLDAKLWIVSDALKAEDLQQKRHHASSSGSLLRGYLQGAGYSVNDVRFETLVPVVPPAGEFLNIENNEQGRAFLAENINSLKERIKSQKPNMVILLGIEALKYILGFRGLPDWRGYIVWSEELDCKCLACYHPQTCIRQRYVATKEFPGQYEALFGCDIKKAVANCKVREFPKHEYELVTQPTFQQAKGELESLIETGTILSYDIETQGDYLMDCISFCSSTSKSLCIPLYYPGLSSIIPYWTVPEERAEILRLIKQLLESDIPKVAQNSKFDTVFLARNYSIFVHNIVWDTLIANHNLYCELPKDLGTLISMYTTLPYHKYMIKEEGARARWIYNALDSLSTLFVMEGQKKEMDDYGITDHYRKITNFSIRPLIDMQVAGIKVDEVLRTRALDHEALLQKEILEAINPLFKKPLTLNKRGKKKKGALNFNPSSRPDKMVLFYEKFGLRKRFCKGKVTVNTDCMEAWSADKRSYVALIAQAVLKYRESVAMRGKLKTPLENGRMYTDFSITGTATGRLSSSETFWGSGTNLQNLKVGVQRQMLIPDEGEEYAVVDLWAAEAFVVAVEGEDVALLKLLHEGKKIHKWLLNHIRAKDTTAFVKCTEDEAYKHAKQLVHLMNYNGQPLKMSQESGLSLTLCEWIYQFYHKNFPGIQRRQLRIQEKLKRTRTLTSLLGRQRVFLAPYGNDLLNDAYAWPSQSCIGEITIAAMGKLYYNGLLFNHEPTSLRTWTFPSLNTHDGIAIRIRKNCRNMVRDVVKKSFAIPLISGGVSTIVPVEIGWADNFNDVTGKEILK